MTSVGRASLAHPPHNKFRIRDALRGPLVRSPGSALVVLHHVHADERMVLAISGALQVFDLIGPTYKKYLLLWTWFQYVLVARLVCSPLCSTLLRSFPKTCRVEVILRSCSGHLLPISLSLHVPFCSVFIRDFVNCASLWFHIRVLS